ncbi:hypothetical protein P7C71_g4875, partial [Lecanoromycetidae sp. Uapishka_2]
MLRNITGPVASTDFAPGAKPTELESSTKVRRPQMIRAPTAPSIPHEQHRSKQEATHTFKRPAIERSSSGPVPQLRANDRKAVKLLGMQLPANRESNSTVSPHSPPSSIDSPLPASSSEDDSTQPSTATSSPSTPAFSTPPSTPPPFWKRYSVSSSPTTATSVSDASHVKAATSAKAAVPTKAKIAPAIHTPHAVDSFPSMGQHYFPYGGVTALSASEIKEEKPDNVLQNVMPFFSDPNKEYETMFKQKLRKLNGKNSEDQLCIEEYLLKSEKSWFGKRRIAELSKISQGNGPEKPPTEKAQERPPDDGFGLAKDHKPPSGLERLLRRKFGDWPFYSFLLAFGQIIAANSYQITLLNGTMGESANKLYIIVSIYLATSLGWWLLYRRLQTVYVVSLPFFFYGLALFLVAMSPFGSNAGGKAWIQNVATGFYATASSSGALYFAVNFADEGGAPVTTFVYRACMIQGTQQIYVVALWYWGAALAKAAGTPSVVANLSTYPNIIVPLCVLVACLMWSVGVVLLLGLPKYYRQAPGHIPSFYTSLFRRKIIVWFFIVVIIQNYWLSAPYGRNWLFLWSSHAAPAWQIALLVLLFFIIIWTIFLYIFSRLSKSHSWILPVFAMGLGAPRWAQILWSNSGTGLYLPWTAGPVASALAGRSLWLWLGVLDAIQGVGFGMILLQTLTRFHVLFTLIAAQIIGSMTTIIARATAPDKIGPGPVFPEICINPKEALNNGVFWVALLFQLAVPVGFGLFFRKEQLSKA